MRSKEEIQRKINELTLEFESTQESYFSKISEKQSGENVGQVDFLKIESEYEILKKEIETLEWTLNINQDE